MEYGCLGEPGQPVVRRVVTVREAVDVSVPLPFQLAVKKLVMVAKSAQKLVLFVIVQVSLISLLL